MGEKIQIPSEEWLFDYVLQNKNVFSERERERNGILSFKLIS